MKKHILSFIRLFGFIPPCLLFFSCVVNKKSNWSDASFDSSYSKDKITSTLLLGDVVPSLGTQFPNGKPINKSSDVHYVHINSIRHGVGVSNENYCTVNFKSDTLCIRIGISYDPGISTGFHILYKDKKFYTIPFYADSHIINGNFQKPVYEVKDQELILDKDHYNPGDSLYGHIYFHITEKYEGMKDRDVEQYASGYFRGKIGNLKYN